MTQCEHEFALDERTKEVRCIKCGDLDDEMQLPNAGLEKAEYECSCLCCLVGCRRCMSNLTSENCGCRDGDDDYFFHKTPSRLGS